MLYQPKFWAGYRAADIARAVELKTPAALDLTVAGRDYYRLFNDGDAPNVNRFMRLCRAANMIRSTLLRGDAETQDDLIEALLDRALASVEA